MKKILLLTAVIYSGNLMAQPKLVSQATINTTTTVIAPDEEDVSNIQPQGEGQGRMNFRNFADGETKSTTYLKNDMVKTVMKSDMGRSTTIRDNAKKLTTTLMEMMGNKTGFVATDEEQAAMRKRVDSMMQATRTSADTTGGTTRRAARPAEVPAEIVYTDETKKIAGLNCKKAYIVSTRFMGLKDSSVVWYTPEIKLQNISSTGGFSAFGNFGGSSSTSALGKLDGFVMRQESKMGRGRSMVIEVTKIDTEKEVADKEFDIPKDFEIKPMKEMQNMIQGGGGPGRTIIRMN
ncbi:MAG: hypothetical protein H7Y86_03790 [Rhizobacter sp.]|nr:hypothetical protein [Ferruginibacter sp.]